MLAKHYHFMRILHLNKETILTNLKHKTNYIVIINARESDQASRVTADDEMQDDIGSKMRIFEIIVQVIFCLSATSVAILCLNLIPVVSKTDLIIHNAHHHLRGVEWTELIGDIRGLQSLEREAREKLEQLKRITDHNDKQQDDDDTKALREARDSNETTRAVGSKVNKLMIQADSSTTSTPPEQPEETTTQDGAQLGEPQEHKNKPEVDSDHEHIATSEEGTEAMSVIATTTTIEPTTTIRTTSPPTKPAPVSVSALNTSDKLPGKLSRPLATLRPSRPREPGPIPNSFRVYDMT